MPGDRAKPALNMRQPDSTYRFRHRIGDVLLIISAGYIGLGLTWAGPPLHLWPPYDIPVAFALVFVAWWIGDYRHRWWPQAPVRDASHELRIDSDKVSSNRKKDG
jgi:hypothetical protein